MKVVPAFHSAVEAVEGYGEQMSGLNTVIRMWGNPPDVPAQKAVWLASSATDGKTGLEVNVLGPRLIVGGAVREMLRRVSGRPPKYPDVKVSDVPAEPVTQA
jgi:glucose 1-dehydrogenase